LNYDVADGDDAFQVSMVDVIPGERERQ